MCDKMRAQIAVLVGVSAVAIALPAGAQSTPDAGSSSGGSTTTDTSSATPTPAAAPSPAAASEPVAAPAPAPDSSPPPPSTPSATESGSLTGTPNPNALGASAGDELRFSSHGFIRAPMRIGMGNRPACPVGTKPGTFLLQNGKPGPYQGTQVPALAPTAILSGGDNTLETPCAGAGQSTTNFHSPWVPDDQYLDPRFTRQWEKDWTEVFMNYGNSYALGTVAFEAFGLTDAEHFSLDNISSQLGIAQAWVTLTPHLGAHIRVKSKIGAFWTKYGMSGKYDAGKYDTYLFARLHTMGELVEFEGDVGDLTFRLSEGFGVKSEELSFSPMAYPFPGYTIVPHAHVGVSYKKIIDFNAHLIAAIAQDARVENFPIGGVGTNGNPMSGATLIPVEPDGHISTTGAEIRFTGGVFGELYAGFSHMWTAEAQEVGPAIEPVSSLGGYSGGPGQPSGSVSPTTDYYGPNGVMDNYLGTCTKCTVGNIGTGSVDTVLVQYDFSFGYLWRKIKNHNASFWGDGPDVKMSLFGEYQSVTSTDVGTAGVPENPLVGNGVKKLKYGTDIIVNPVSWFGFGVRADYVQPTSLDAHESFGVISPKIMFRSSYLSHEEVTAQYSHYVDGADVMPQAPNGPLSYGGGPGCLQTYSWNCSVPDKNVFGVKATMWW
jgi:hypothetical protein